MIAPVIGFVCMVGLASGLPAQVNISTKHSKSRTANDIWDLSQRDYDTETGFIVRSFGPDSVPQTSRLSELGGSQTPRMAPVEIPQLPTAATPEPHNRPETTPGSPQARFRAALKRGRFLSNEPDNAIAALRECNLR